jgi:hypothetical protein
MEPAPGDSYPTQIRNLRSRLGLTQVALAERLGGSFPTVNRWENGKSVPSQLAWEKLLELSGDSASENPRAVDSHPQASPVLDCAATPEVVAALVEGERLSFGHLSNTGFSTVTSNIDPLPHQRIAVYDCMLKQPRLRFLLADDAGAGKTIMTGVYVRAMLSRRLTKRVLIVPPAGLNRNWQREIQVLFNLNFSVVVGEDARVGNPFFGSGVDTLAGERVFARLREAQTQPYDLIVFDEARKLSVDRGNDLRIRKTDRYKLAEGLSGVRGSEEASRLPWTSHHLLLLTATPHYGKKYPYCGLRRLLKPEVLLTPEALAKFPAAQRSQCLSVVRPEANDSAVWVHPGEPVFEQIHAMVSDRLNQQAMRGAVFIDPTAVKPYLFHVALVQVIREGNPSLRDLATEVVLDCRLVGIKQKEESDPTICPVEQLLLFKGGSIWPPAAHRLAAIAEKYREQTDAYLTERVARSLAHERRERLVATSPEREQFIERGYNYQETELEVGIARLSDKTRANNAEVMKSLREVKEQQRSLTQRRAIAMATIRRVPELIAPGNIYFIAHALVVPSTNKEDLMRHDAEVELGAMRSAKAFEETAGATVKDVHTPALARAAGLTDYPGFDLLAIYPPCDSRGQRAIEVKGRAGTGDVEVSANEWARAANLRCGYWLYVVYNCASAAPNLNRVQDPFAHLLTGASGRVLVSAIAVLQFRESR